MTTRMKMFLYEIDQQISIVDSIDHVKNLDMGDRVKHVSGNDMKLEYAKEKRVENSNLILMDFCKHRDSGPGRAKRDKETKGFDLGEDEAFGEMTAALYDPATHFIVIQYNHHGPRAGSIASYFSRFLNHGLVFKPRIRDDILAELDKKQYNHSFSFKYSSAALTDEHKKQLGIFTSLRGLESIASNIAEVEIIIKKKPRSRQKLENSNPFLQNLFTVSNESGGAITSAKVTGAMTPEDEPEFLDLLNAKISEEREGLAIDPKTQMYSLQSRGKLLSDSFRSWKRSGVITAGPR